MNLSTGIIFNIQRFCINDGPGIRTTVFFKGCPLNCIWCQNPESRKCGIEKAEIISGQNFNNHFQNDNSIGKRLTVDAVFQIIKKDCMFYEESKGGVTFSGGEPMNQIDFLFDLLKRCKGNDIHTAVDTCGYAPFEQFEKILPYTDLFLFDLKIIDEDDHLRYTGVSNKLILENLSKLTFLGKNIVIRIPLISNITDTDKNIDETIQFVSELKSIKQISLLPFNEISKSKYKKLNAEYKLETFQTQSKEKLIELRTKFSSHNFEVKLRG